MPEERICSDCGAKLFPDAQGGLCIRCLFTLGLKIEAGTEAAAPVVPITEKAGDRIGRYKLLQKIGEGGCGVVYMAEQEEPVRRRVALKVIKLGMDTREVIARFEAERQALAMMDHPNIAKIFDAGATGYPLPSEGPSPVGRERVAEGRVRDGGEWRGAGGEDAPESQIGNRKSEIPGGRPYFVMELVRGVKITEYCDQHNLSTRERLDLFINVCQAIQHAHQKGIIHRDIKPSNILVTVNDGVPVPKVIDFGIAKATEGRLTDKTLFTAFQQFMGTPAYMSPEQAEMTSLDIDTRSDIYSLGVLLYELLTGKTPFDAKELGQVGIDAMRRTIREVEPPKPSTRLSTLLAADQTEVARRRHTDPPKLMNLLRGDLDWIVMKCLEKDRTRRYETSNGLAADIQRHLKNEAVLASPPANLYRIRKTMRRHKLAFAAATAVLASLVIGLGTATVMFFKERTTGSELLRKNTELKLKKAEVDLKKAEVEHKNAEFRAMLVEAARSDCFVAEDELQLGHEQKAFAHLARASEYDPWSTLPAVKAIAALGFWNHDLPTLILAGHQGVLVSARFSPDGTRIVTTSGNRLTTSSNDAPRVWDAATGKMLVTLTGHADQVWSAQFSPDGTRIVTASDDKFARIWDAETGKTLVTLTGHTESVRSAQFGPDGKCIVTASEDKTVRVWDAITGETVTAYGGEADSGNWQAVQFSPDGKRILTAWSDWNALTTNVIDQATGKSAVLAWPTGTTRVWEAATGSVIATLVESEGQPSSAQFSPDGTRIVTVSEHKTVRVWDAATGKALALLDGHENYVNTAQFSPDGTRIVTTSEDNSTRVCSTRVWDAFTGKPLMTLAGYEGGVLVHSAQFSPDGTRIVTASSDKTARVWDAATGKALATLAGHEEQVWSAQFSQDGTGIVTTSEDKTARVWEIHTSKPKAILAGHEGGVISAQFSPDGTRIVTTSKDKTARVWDAATGKTLATLPGHDVGLSAQFSPDGTRIVTGTGNRPARVWDAATGKTLATLATLDAHGEQVGNPRFSPDGRCIVTSSGEKTAHVWDAATGLILVTLDGHEETVWNAQFSPDGTHIVTVSRNKTARVWDAATGKALSILAGHEEQVRSPQFSPDGTRIVTASEDKTARVWDVATGKTLATLPGHQEQVNSAQFSPDGTRIVTASEDKTARVWDSATGKLLATLAGHAKGVGSAHFSRDGSRIVTVSSDKTARVWDTATGKALVTLAGPEGWINSAQFSPDGTRIVTASEDKTARVWDLLPPSAGPPPDWFPSFLRYMAQMRLNLDGALETLKTADWLALRERLRGVLRAGAGADTPYLRILRKYVRE